MKRKILFILIMLVLMLSSCKKNNIQNEQYKENFQTALLNRKDSSSCKIKETTTLTTFNGTQNESVRQTEVNVEKNYSYSEIEYDNIKGSILYSKNQYNYKFGNEEKSLTFKSKFSTTQLMGINYLLLTTKDYKIKEKIATKKIDYKINGNLDSVIENVKLDTNQDYEVIEGQIVVEVYYDDGYIQSINIDLSNVFKNLKSIVRKIEFLEINTSVGDNVENISQTDKYKVSTSEVLDTYVFEMLDEYSDSIFLKSGNFEMLIDTGEYVDGPSIRNMISTYCTDGILDVLIMTHHHGDHVNGFKNGALDGVQNINLIIDYGYVSYQTYYESKREAFNNDYYCAYDCINGLYGASKKYIISDDLSFEILDTGQYLPRESEIADTDNANDFSVVFRLDFKNNSYLYTGDIAGDYYEKNLTEKENVKNITVYKAAHHGAVSYKSNTQSFLNFVNPQICVVSAALTADPINQWHPTKEFVRRVLNTPNISKNKNLYYNGTMGTIHISDNGIDLPTVTGFGAKKQYKYNGSFVTGENNLKFVDTKLYLLR